MIDRVISRHTLEGLVIDPVEGVYAGELVLEGDRIASVHRREDGPREPLLFPGFVDLHVYDPSSVAASGVTGYLLATRELRTVDDPLCLGLHLEGPFLNTEAAGAIPVDELRAVDPGLAEEWIAADGAVRLVTLAPELQGALDVTERLAAAGIVVGLGHTRANALTATAAIEAGARFATHLWNATRPVRARTTGSVPTLLTDERVTVGLIADGRHLHPLIEELTVRVAGPARIALTSDIVPPPAHRPDGSLLGGDRSGAALVAHMARFGLQEAATMASLVPAQLLGLADRGRLVPGYRADIAVLDSELRPVQTIAAGEPV
jgi:N-acetylglucosamine-6-phosphate deacetylase